MVCTVVNILRIKGSPQARPMARLRECALQWQYTISGTCCRMTACTSLCTPEIFAAPSHPCARILWMSIPNSVRVSWTFQLVLLPSCFLPLRSQESPLTSSLFSPSFLCTKRIHIEICSFAPESVASSAKKAKEWALLQSRNNNLRM